MSKRKNLNNVDLSFHLQHPGRGNEPGDPNAIFYLNGVYLILAITLFYYSFGQARKRGTLINIGE